MLSINILFKFVLYVTYFSEVTSHMLLRILNYRLKEGLKRIDNIVEIEFRPTLERLAESCEQIPLLDESIKKINEEKADNVGL